MDAAGATRFRLTPRELDASALRAQVIERCRRTLHHDVNNAIQSIHSGLELLTKCVETPDLARVSPHECLALLQEQFASLRTTLGKLIDDIAAPPRDPERIDLAQLVQEAATMLRHEAPIHTATMHLEAGALAEARLTQVRTLILALLFDALDQRDGSEPIELDVSATGGSARLLIRIQAAPRTDGRSDTALLDLVARVAAGENAQVSVSNEQRERIVTLTLTAPSAATDSPESTRTLRVVIADRNRDAADSLAMIVRLDGHEAYAVYDGARLRELLHAQPADVVVLDAALPNSDAHAIAQLARSVAAAPLLVYASNSAPADPADFDAQLAHPIEWPQLQHLLDERTAQNRTASG